MSDSNRQLAEILSAISLLSSRIGEIEKRLGKLDNIELIVTEMAKKLLASAECRALGILPPPSPAGTPQSSVEQPPLAAKSP